MGEEGRRWYLTLALTVALAFSGVDSVLAQEFAIGFRGGLNAGYTLYEVEVAAREVRPGLLAGGTLAYHWRPWVGVQTELLFTQKGWAAAEGEGGMRMSYLEIPILLKLQHPSSLQPRILLGPTFGLEVDCSFDAIGGTDRVDCDHPQISLSRPSFDTGLMAGVGIGRWVGPGTLSFDMLFDFGLTDVIREPLPWGRQSNFALSLSLAYAFDPGWRMGGDR